MNTLPLILAAIVTALNTDLGTFDLSTADQVRVGTYVKPPGSVAFAAILPAELTDSEPQCRDAWYLETHRIVVRLWAPFTASTTDNRVARGRLLAEEAQVALDNARSGNTALTRCVSFRVGEIDPDPAGATSLANWAHSTIAIILQFRRLSGTGT